MAWYNKQDEQAQEQWNSRVAHKRLDLSASVEEALRDVSVQEELEPDEADNSGKPSKGSTLIPPRLSLQSKYMPAVPADATTRAAKSLPATAAEREVSAPENTNILSRFAQRLTSSLTSFSGMLQPTLPAPREETSSPAEVDEVPPAQPDGHHPSYPGHETAHTALPTTRSERSSVTIGARSAEVSTPAQNKQRFAKRTTKVRLQVVPKPEETRSAEEAKRPMHTVTAGSSLPAMERLEKAAGTILPDVNAGLSGVGSFERGQSDAVITNVKIASSSVVVVVLTGDPGPVVVQYVSLQPKVGFTVHLSAPTKNKTPFNYAIL